MLTRRAVVIAGAVAALVGAGLLTPAAAAPPARQGWWRASVEVLGVDLTALLDPSSVDVPSDGLLVAGGSSPGEPQAYAAVAYDLAGATLTGPLRLAPHPTAASVPGSTAVACPLDDAAFAPAQGGRADEGPGYDCLGSVPGTVAEDGAYLFDLSTLQRGDSVAVAILPGTNTSRIVFAAPGDESLPLAAAIAPAAPAVPAAPASAPASVSPVVGGDLVSAPAADVPSSPAAVPAETDDGPAPAGFATPIPSGSGRGSAGRAYVLLALAAVAGVAWTFAGRPRRTSGAAA
jgi:hypothetical protein